MKVRILGNSIRLRIKMHEADAIRETGLIEEVLEFGPKEEEKFRFQIITGEEELAIEQAGTRIAIIVPRTLIHTWTTTDMVGFEETITTSSGRQIEVLIEKDFACLDGERDDEPGSYPNPIEGCKTE